MNESRKQGAYRGLILSFVSKNSGVGNKDIAEYLRRNISEVPRRTLIRELNLLVDEEIIERRGKGRGVKYYPTSTNPLLVPFNVDRYFKDPPDVRNVAHVRFNSDIFGNLGNLFLENEIDELAKHNTVYQERKKELSETILQREFERLIIELSWKSSHLEGNTYTLLDTEALITRGQEAAGHSREESLMILNHKKAIDYIIENKKLFKEISFRAIENVHALLVEELGIPKGFRTKPVGITGTRYRPLDNEHQTREVVEKMIETINKSDDPFTKALIALLMISYTQPFEDGNKRTARLLANALLLSHDASPLSFRSVDDAEYKKGLILFYEQNSALYFKNIFVEQFIFAVENYFRA